MTQDSKNEPKEDSQHKPESEKNSTPDSSQDGDDSQPDRGKCRVFVYGSLKSQCGNNVLLKQVGAECLGYDSITGDFQMMSFGGFPGVVRTNEGSGVVNTIYGEVWAMNPEGLRSLDLLESHPSFYERRKYRTDVLDRNTWMYTLPGGEGYLDAEVYDQVPECIWRSDENEDKYWAAYHASEG